MRTSCGHSKVGLYFEQNIDSYSLFSLFGNLLLYFVLPAVISNYTHSHLYRGKSALGQSEQFKSFRSTFALRQLAVDLNDGEWRFYDGGPKKTPVLLCLPGASGTAECFYRIMDVLCKKGYRIVSAQHPPYYNINEFVIGTHACERAVFVPASHASYASLSGQALPLELALIYSVRSHGTQWRRN